MIHVGTLTVNTEPAEDHGNAAADLDHLSEAIDKTRALLDSLGGRISPVLGPERPTIAAAEPALDPSSCSPLRARLHDLHRDLRLIQRYIGSLIERAEL